MSVVGRLGWNSGQGEGPNFEIRTVYDLIDVIEMRPGLFTGSESVSALYWLLDGYHLAVATFGIEVEAEVPPFSGFSDFVARRYRRSASTAGWRNIILDKFKGDEIAGFKAFFILLREFRQGQSRRKSSKT
jgi:hypothetical protein